MTGCLVAQRNNSKHTALKFWNDSPETEAVMFLRFDPDGPFYHADTPLFFRYGRFLKTSFSKYSVYLYSAISTLLDYILS